MRAFIVPEFGQAGSVEERPRPEPQEGQLLVRIRAAGVNAMDPIISAGYAKDYMEHRFPLTPGTDYAGTVEAVGPGVEGFAAGDEVFGDAGKAYAGEGTYAEFATVAAGLAARRPAGLSPEVAAALPRSGSTALAALDAIAPSPGETVAIIGAAGGVGGIATQLAADRGLRVIAATRNDRADHVRSLGASEVVDYDTDDLPGEIRRLAPDGVAGLIDLYHDAEGLLAFVPAVRPGGRIATPIAMGVDQAFEGQPVSAVLVAAAVDRAQELGELAAAGTITPSIEVVPLDDAAEALDRQASRQVRGKLVIAVSR